MKTLALPIELSPAQMQQQLDLSRRMLHMAALGAPRVPGADDDTPALLALHALATTYLAIAAANPGTTLGAAQVAQAVAEQLQAMAQRRAATAH